MKYNNIHDYLQVEVNSNSLLIETKKLREYFDIEYVYNFGEILKQFSKRLGKSILTEMPDIKEINELE